MKALFRYVATIVLCIITYGMFRSSMILGGFFGYTAFVLAILYAGLSIYVFVQGVMIQLGKINKINS